MSDVVASLDAVRTPFGRYGGALAGVRPDDLAAHVRRARWCEPHRRGFDPAGIDDVLLRRRQRRRRGQPQRRPHGRRCSPGCRPACPARRSTGCAARAWRPRSRRRRAIAAGDASTSSLAGGVESMSRAPWVLLKPAKALPRRPRDAALDHARLADGQPGDARREWTISLGESAEMLADQLRRSRARRRTRSRCAATSAPPRPGTTGVYDDEVVAVAGHRPRRATRASAPTRRWRSSARLKPAFRKDGTVTAGNASPLNDGAAALLLADEARPRAGSGATPLARIVSPRRARRRPATSSASARSRPPTGRSRRAGIGWADLDVGRAQRGVRRRSRWPACADWPDLDPDDRQRQRRRDRDRPPARRVAAPASSARSRTSCTAAAAAGAWPPSASASARAWPSSCEPEER